MGKAISWAAGARVRTNDGNACGAVGPACPADRLRGNRRFWRRRGSRVRSAEHAEGAIARSRRIVRRQKSADRECVENEIHHRCTFRHRTSRHIQRERTRPHPETTVADVAEQRERATILASADERCGLREGVAGGCAEFLAAHRDDPRRLLFPGRGDKSGNETLGATEVLKSEKVNQRRRYVRATAEQQGHRSILNRQNIRRLHHW